jgi:cobaltochelatase CobS
MEKTAWMATRDGFQKVALVSEDQRGRVVRVLGGERDGQTIALPPEGVPNGQYNPALYLSDEPPAVWRFKGRSLRVLSPEEFADPGQAKALVPVQEPYVFLPHTTQIIDGVLAGDHQLLFGSTGVGKTSLILQIAARIGQPVIRINFNGQVAVNDVVGSLGFGKDGTTWSDGALVTAMKRGFWVCLDEFDYGSPEILSIFYPVLEAKPKLCLKEHNGEIVEAHPRFRVFATGNSIGGDRDGRYCGTQALNAALLNRFTGHGQAIKIEAMTARQERDVLKARLPNLSKSLLRRACDFASRLRVGDGQQPALLPTFSTRELIQFCNKMVIYRDPIQSAEITFLAVIEDPNVRQPLSEMVKLIFGKRVIVGRGCSTGRSPAPRKPKASGASVSPPSIASPAATKGGRVASEVTDPREIEAIWRAYKGNGGTQSYKQMEADPRFDLRPANGNTAYRVVKKFGAAGATTGGETPTAIADADGR